MLGIVIVVLAAAIIILVMMKGGQPAANQQATTQQGAGVVKSEDGTKIEKITNVVTPGVAVDSSEIPQDQINQIPLNSEAILKYGNNGLETKSITAKAGARVFLTFHSEDDAKHTFSFSEPSMETVLVVFSKEEGDKSINFLAPGPGTYQYLIDNNEKGELIITQ